MVCWVQYFCCHVLWASDVECSLDSVEEMFQISTKDCEKVRSTVWMRLTGSVPYNTRNWTSEEKVSGVFPLQFMEDTICKLFDLVIKNEDGFLTNFLQKILVELEGALRAFKNNLLSSKVERKEMKKYLSCIEVSHDVLGKT